MCCSFPQLIGLYFSNVFQLLHRRCGMHEPKKLNVKYSNTKFKFERSAFFILRGASEIKNKIFSYLTLFSLNICIALLKICVIELCTTLSKYSVWIRYKCLGLFACEIPTINHVSSSNLTLHHECLSKPHCNIYWRPNLSVK